MVCCCAAVSKPLCALFLKGSSVLLLPSVTGYEAACMLRRANKRLFLLDYDGTLIPCSSINSRPTAEVLAVLKALVADQRNVVYIISGRGRSELGDWFESVVRPGPAGWGAGCGRMGCVCLLHASVIVFFGL